MMETLNDFHFLRPWWFLTLIPVVIALIGLWWGQSLAQQWQQYIAPHLLPFLVDKQHIKLKRWPITGIGALWLCAVIALASPVWQKIPIPVERNSNALVICWDLSPSMLAEDIKPSRLVKSRLKIIDLLKSKHDGQVALVAFSGEAYAVTPLTDDFQTIINLLPALSPTTLPSVGSNPEMALEQAITLLEDGGVLEGNIIMLTDEITRDAMDNLKSTLSSTPHQVTFWGIGTQEGAPIPLPQGGFAKNSSGDLVVAKLNQDQLQSFSVDAGAYYVPVVNGDSDIETLDYLTNPVTESTEATERKIDQWFEYGQYLVFLILPFSLFLFRRGIIFTVLIIPASLYQPKANALSWQDLWQTQNQQAQKALENGNEEAALEFTTPEKRGYELFKQSKFNDAAQQFSQGDSAELDYNRGTALVKAGEYESAITSFQSALDKKPDFTDASHNLAIAEKLLELSQANQQDGENQESDDQQNNDGDRSEEENSDGQQSENQQQEGQDQQSQDQQSQDQAQDQSQNNKDEPSGESQQAQNAEQSSSEDSNPFATESSDSSSSSSASTEMTQTQEQEASAENEQEDEANQTMTTLPSQPQEKPLTEEEQMLEQWLRKIPDDPSGLMREKFKHQYMQRKQKFGNQFSPGQKQAEKRW